MDLENTHFENPVGLDEEGHYSSASDLATIARLAMQNPEFTDIVATEYASIYTPDREIPLTSTNQLLFAYGPATGTTPAAGESLVSSASVGDESHLRDPRLQRRAFQGLYADAALRLHRPRPQEPRRERRTLRHDGGSLQAG